MASDEDVGQKNQKKERWSRSDIIAASAVVIALISGGYQMYREFFTSHNLSILPVRQVVFHLEKYPGGNRYLRIGAMLSFINTAPQDKVAIVENVKVKFPYNSDLHEQQWHDFAVIDWGGQGELDYKNKTGAQPLAIPGGMAVSREVVFATYPKDCLDGPDASCNPYEPLIPKKEFIGWAHDGMVLDFTFETTVSGQAAPLCTACRVRLTEDDIIGIFGPNKWMAPVCHAIEAKCAPK